MGTETPPARTPNNKQTHLGVSTGQETRPVKAAYKPDTHLGCSGASSLIPPGLPTYTGSQQLLSGSSLSKDTESQPQPLLWCGQLFLLGRGHSSLLVLKLNHLSNKSPKIQAPLQDAQITKNFITSWVRKLGGEQSSIFIWEPKEGTHLAPQ